MNKKNGVPATVKKTTKKAAKKTYSKKKIPSKSRRITINDLAAVIVGMAKSREETDNALRKLYDENAKALRKLSENLGHIGNDIGELTEFIVIPKIRLAMNATGKHSFDTIQTDRMFKHIDELGEKKTFTEVDVLLYSNEEIMAVEIKSHLVIRDVKDHIERLEKLRRHEDLVGIKDKKLVGAVVGAVVDKDVKNFALERGLCVVTIREEEDKLDITEPETCRTW